MTPAYEGWYRNADGTFSLSFGYLNRNAEEVVDVPIGPNNFITPGDAESGTADGVPAAAALGRLRGEGAGGLRRLEGSGLDAEVPRRRRTRFPGALHPNWQIDALEGEAGSGNTPPVLKFDADGSGRRAVRAASPPDRSTATVGQPLTITVWASDDGAARRAGQRGAAAVARGAPRR